MSCFIHIDNTPVNQSIKEDLIAKETDIWRTLKNSVYFHVDNGKLFFKKHFFAQAQAKVNELNAKYPSLQEDRVVKVITPQVSNRDQFARKYIDVNILRTLPSDFENTDYYKGDEALKEQENRLFSPFALFNTLSTQKKPIKLNEKEYKELYSGGTENIKFSSDGSFENSLFRITFEGGKDGFSRFKDSITNEDGLLDILEIQHLSNKELPLPSFTELWNTYQKSGKFSSSMFNLSIIKRIMAGSGFIGGLQESLQNKGLVTNISIQNNNSEPVIQVVNKVLYLNFNDDFVNILTSYSPYEATAILEFMLSEEYLHIIQHNTISSTEIDKIWDELSNRDKELIKTSYHKTNDLSQVNQYPKETYVLELLRMKTQKILYGKSSEELTSPPTLVSFLKKIFKQVLGIFKNKPKDSITNLILQRQLDFIEGKNTPLVNDNFNIISPSKELSVEELYNEAMKISQEDIDERLKHCKI